MNKYPVYLLSTLLVWGAGWALVLWTPIFSGLYHFNPIFIFLDSIFGTWDVGIDLSVMLGGFCIYFLARTLFPHQHYDRMVYISLNILSVLLLIIATAGYFALHIILMMFLSYGTPPNCLTICW